MAAGTPNSGIGASIPLDSSHPKDNHIPARPPDPAQDEAEPLTAGDFKSHGHRTLLPAKLDLLASPPTSSTLWRTTASGSRSSTTDAVELRRSGPSAPP
ncbi:unnamed protein product [Urochloa humidicola]